MFDDFDLGICCEEDRFIDFPPYQYDEDDYYSYTNYYNSDEDYERK